MATQLTPIIMVSPGDLTQNTSTAQAIPGTYIESNDGRGFRYCKAGATLAVGKLYQSPATVTGNQNLAVAAAAIGATTVTTTTTVTVTANQYAEGWLIVSSATGLGYQYKIKSHPAATSAVVTITLEDPIQVALDTTSRVEFVANPYVSPILSLHTSQSGTPIGVAVYPITSGNYGWLQTHGPCALLADDAIVVDTQLAPSDTVDGAVTQASVTTDSVIVGSAMEAITDQQYGAVHLTID